MSESKFYICRTCGNIIGKIHDSGVPVVCCGKPMEHLVANTVEASTEKHIPVVSVEGDTIKAAVGSVPHPMAEEHYIMWIYLETENGGQRISLKPGETPEVCFKVCDEKPIAVYEYCNLHGLWKAEL